MAAIWVQLVSELEPGGPLVGGGRKYIVSLGIVILTQVCLLRKGLQKDQSGFLEELISVGQVRVNSWDGWLFLGFSSLAGLLLQPIILPIIAKLF